ncbi:uncharacterized protein LOC143187551 [Calliopsis andreniformis]|uniref:uncharacterized protein LOC143187551 n=1 Tax=Calliopsis andreniformis TaxID=337506 RepID=UPI003FCCCFC7
MTKEYTAPNYITSSYIYILIYYLICKHSFIKGLTTRYVCIFGAAPRTAGESWRTERSYQKGFHKGYLEEPSPYGASQLAKRLDICESTKLIVTPNRQQVTLGLSPHRLSIAGKLRVPFSFYYCKRYSPNMFYLILDETVC